MKTWSLGLASSLVLLVGCAEIPLNMGAATNTDRDVLTGGPIRGTTIAHLPQEVRETLKRQVPNAEIRDIDKTTRDGRVMYKISFAKPRENPRLWIAENGLLDSEIATAAAATAPAAPAGHQLTLR